MPETMLASHSFNVCFWINVLKFIQWNWLARLFLHGFCQNLQGFQLLYFFLITQSCKEFGNGSASASSSMASCTVCQKVLFDGLLLSPSPQGMAALWRMRAQWQLSFQFNEWSFQSSEGHTFYYSILDLWNKGIFIKKWCWKL